MVTDITAWNQYFVLLAIRELENCQDSLHDRPVASADSLGRWNMQEWVERIISKMKNDYKLIFSLLITLVY